MDTGAVSGVAFYKNLSTTHGVPRRVTDIAVDDDLSGVHGISYCVLSIGPDGDRPAVQVRAQGVAGDAVDIQGLIRHPGSDEPLPTASVNGTRFRYLTDSVIKGLVIQPFRMDRHHIINSLPCMGNPKNFQFLPTQPHAPEHEPVPL